MLVFKFIRGTVFATVLLSIFCLGSCSLQKDSEISPYDCNPAKDPNGNFSVNNLRVEFRTVSFNLVSSPDKDSVCTWTIDPIEIKSSLLVNRLALSPGDSLTVIGTDDKKVDTVLYKGYDLINAGFIDVKSYHSVRLVLDLKKDNVGIDRSFSAQYTWVLPTVLSEPQGELTLSLNQGNNSVDPNLELSPPFSQLNEVVFLLNFLTYPKEYKISVNNVEYNNTNNPLPRHLLLQNSTLTLNAIDYKPKDNPITVRYWAVTKDCSKNVRLKAGDKPVAVQFIKYEDRNKMKLMQARCVQVVQGEQDKQIVVDVPADTSSLLYPQDSLSFYDTNGTIEFALNQGALLYFRNIDIFLTKSEYLVIYKTPYFTDKFNPNFTAPTLRIASNSGSFMVEDDKPLEKTVGDGKTVLDDIHVVYSSGLMVPGGAASKEIHLEFVEQKAPLGNWSVSVHDSEMKGSSPLMTLGQFDLLPSVIPIQTGVVKVVFKGQVPPLKLRYRSVDKKNTCAFLSSSSSGTNLRGFDVRGNQSTGACTWLIPENSADFTILSPVVVRVPVNKTLSLTTFQPKGSFVQQFRGPIEKTFIPDVFLSPKSAYEVSIDPSGSDSGDLHVMFEQRNNYLNSSIMIDEKISSISSVNYPGTYPLGYNQSYYLRQQGPVLMVVEDMALLPNDSFSYVSSNTPEQIFISNDLSNVYDLILAEGILLTFDTKKVDLNALMKDKSASTSRGFNIGLWHFSNATEIDVSKNNSFQFKVDNYSSPNAVLWKVFYEDKSVNVSDSILKINITFVEEPKKLNANIKIYDSKSLRKGASHEALVGPNSTDKERQYITSTRISYIVYNFSEAAANKLNYGINVSIAYEKCSHSKNYTLSKCKTVDRCITDPMICNGVDDCGDWSDELFCSGNAPPVPPAEPTGSGVSVLVAIFLLMPLGAILGIFGYVYLPNLLARLRNGRYSEFRDLSSVS